MEANGLMNRLQIILDDARTGVLATVDSEGKPRMRWMTPVVLRWRPGVLFCVTYPGSQKIKDLDSHRDVQWMIQNRALTEIVYLKGIVNVLDVPSVKAELMETLAPRLNVFWKVNIEQTEFVALETVITEATIFRPMQGQSETITF